MNPAEARPAPIRWFARALLTAAAIDLANNILSMPAMRDQLAARNMAVSPAALFIGALIAPALAVVFWYFVARRGSVIAKWVMTVLAAAGLGIFAMQVARVGAGAAGSVRLAIVAVTEVLKIFAVGCLYLPASRIWFQRTPATGV